VADRTGLRALCLLLFVGCGPGEVTFDTSAADDTDTDTEVEDTDTEVEDTDTTETDTTETDTEDTAPEIVIAGELSVAPNPDNAFSALATVTVDHDAEVWMTYGEGGLDHETPRVSARAGEPVEIVVLGLRASRTFALAANAAEGDATWASESVAFTTDPLDESWPACTPTFHADESEFDPDEVVCTNLSSTAGVYRYGCVDRWGEPVYSMRTADNDSLMSMRALADGTWASTSLTASKLALFSATGEQTAQYPIDWFNARTRYRHDYIDSHEVYQIPFGAWEGKLVFLTGIYDYLSDGSYRLGNGLIVWDPASREVVYDYSFHGATGDGVAGDALLPYERAGYGDYYEDWNHTNAVLYDEDAKGEGYFLLSLKSQEWIVKLSPDTDQLEWAMGFDGDFTLVNDIDASRPAAVSTLGWFYHQHGMTFLERGDARGRLLMFDNGYPRREADGSYRWDVYESRAIEVAYDEVAKTAAVTWSWPEEAGEDSFFSYYCGNAELLPGDDAVMLMDGQGSRMVEVGYPTGGRRWEMQCPSVEVCAYRVRYFPSLYERGWEDR